MSKPNNLNVAAIAERYAHAWTSHDPDAILALHAPNSTFQAHGRIGEVRGHDALRKEFAQVFERYLALVSKRTGFCSVKGIGRSTGR
jgi:SnoaL-like domain